MQRFTHEKNETGEKKEEVAFIYDHGSHTGNGERHAITWLRSNDDIIIRRADKGGATVIWEKKREKEQKFRGTGPHDIPHALV
uniref:Uncharacterized protein n=1 Tax=Knipowitschia caucasica TaxID=637954 RepID=A0AAV2MAT1_KNICA